MNYLIEMYLSHRYDLLGSGWVNVGYAAESIGFEKYKYSMNQKFELNKLLLKSHYNHSKNILHIIDQSYSPIDWQRDSKSGFRYSQKKWFKEIKPGSAEGVDIKWPWELARMQHLPQLAVYAHHANEKRSAIIREFKNQIVDFVAANPPGMGVNWVCTMDVAIRVVNMLVAYDILKGIDRENILNEEFSKIISESVYDHGRHILNNLEWYPRVRTNHYLSDIAGLLFVATYLERTDEIDSWLAFALQELIKETGLQFYEDGGNFESSTSYHRLSSEILVFSTALILGLDDDKKQALYQYNRKKWNRIPRLDPIEKQAWYRNGDYIFPDWYFERLYRAGMFTYHLTKPTNEISQIGDNDSGRFIRLSPNGIFMTNLEASSRYLNLSNYGSMYPKNEMYWDENVLDHRTLLSALIGLYSENVLDNLSSAFPIEREVTELLSKGKKIFVKPEWKELKKSNKITLTPVNSYDYNNIMTIYPKKGNQFPLDHNLSVYEYPESGIYIIKSNRFHLSVYSTPIGQNGIGGHMHIDKGAFELNVDGEDYYVDPGTYVYTASPEWRNTFRSASAHNSVPVPEFKMNEWKKGLTDLFAMKNSGIAEIHIKSKTNINICYRIDEIVAERVITVAPDKIVINDFCNHRINEAMQKFEYYSNGYGKLLFVS